MIQKIRLSEITFDAKFMHLGCFKVPNLDHGHMNDIIISIDQLNVYKWQFMAKFGNLLFTFKPYKGLIPLSKISNFYKWKNESIENIQISLTSKI